MSAAVGTRSRRVTLGTTALALALTSLPVGAQQQAERVMETNRTPRRYVLPWVGAAVGGAASLIYFWSGPRSLPGTCSQPMCVGLVSLGGGAFVGWLVGREKDQLHELRYRGAMPIRPSNTMDISLSGDPVQLTVGGGMVAASGTGGVHLISGDNELRVVETKAAGLRGVSDAVLVQAENTLGLTASGGLYKFPLAAGNGTHLRGAPATAVAALGNDFVVASGNRVERITRSANDVAQWPGITLNDSVRAVKVDVGRGLVWAVTATNLIALQPAADSFTVVSRTAIPRGSTTKLDVAGSVAAIALGDSGVRFISVSNPSQPQHVTDWRDTRYVHDVALAGGKIFVAAAIDGVVVLSLNGDALTHHGLMRELGLVVSVEADERYVYVLDRSGTSAVMRRFPVDYSK